MTVGCYTSGISWTEVNPQDIETHVWDVCKRWLSGNYTVGQTKGVCQIMNGALGIHALFQVHWTGPPETSESYIPNLVTNAGGLDQVACMQAMRSTIPPNCNEGGTAFRNGFWFR